MKNDTILILIQDRHQMKKLFILTIITLFIFFGTSCNRCGECFSPPNPINLRIFDKNDTTDLIFTGIYHPDSITIFFMDTQNKVYVENEIYIDSASMSGFISSVDIAWKSNAGYKNFYLKLSEKETDTIFLNIQSVTEKCCTSHPVHSFTINGTETQFNSDQWYYFYFK